MHYEKITQVQSRIIIGTKQTLKSMNNGQVKEVFVASDAQEEMTSKVVKLAKELDIPCHHVDSMKKLGEACGIEVSATTVAIRK